jgi:hypothetical protein
VLTNADQRHPIGDPTHFALRHTWFYVGALVATTQRLSSGSSSYPSSDLGGDLDRLAVLRLRLGPDETERLVGVAKHRDHDDPLCLPDEVSSAQRYIHVVHAIIVYVPLGRHLDIVSRLRRGHLFAVGLLRRIHLIIVGVSYSIALGVGSVGNPERFR